MLTGPRLQITGAVIPANPSSSAASAHSSPSSERTSPFDGLFTILVDVGHTLFVCQGVPTRIPTKGAHASADSSFSSSDSYLTIPLLRRLIPTMTLAVVKTNL